MRPPLPACSSPPRRWSPKCRRRLGLRPRCRVAAEWVAWISDPSPVRRKKRRAGGPSRAFIISARSIGVPEFCPPPGCAFRDEIEEVPDPAEIIAGRERSVRDPDDATAVALEHRYPRHRAVAPITHVLRESRPLARHHGKPPAAATCEFLLLLRRVW